MTIAQMDLLAAQVAATGDAGANFVGWAAEEQDTYHFHSYTGRLSQALSAEDHNKDKLDQYDNALRRGGLRGVGRSDRRRMPAAAVRTREMSTKMKESLTKMRPITISRGPRDRRR